MGGVGVGREEERLPQVKSQVAHPKGHHSGQG